MKTSDPSKKKSMEYNRVIINVPSRLLEGFDKVCDIKHYSRVEAIKQAMREFIDNSLPDDYMSPDESKQMYESMMMGWMDAAVKVAKDPKYSELQKQGMSLPADMQGPAPATKKKKHGGFEDEYTIEDDLKISDEEKEEYMKYRKEFS